MATAPQNEYFYADPSIAATQAAILAAETAGTLVQYRWYVARDTNEVYWASATNKAVKITGPTRYSVSISVGLNNPVTVTHNLGTTAVVVSVVDASNAVVFPTVTVTGINTITVNAGGALQTVTVNVVTGVLQCLNL